MRKPPTGEPCAGEPPARFGGRGGCKPFSTPIAAAKRRARSAAQRLIDFAHIHGSVALVGHGVMNHLIGRELRAQGWRCCLRPGKDYWAYAVYEAN